MIEKILIVFLESALENHTDTLKKFTKQTFLKFCYVVLFIYEATKKLYYF